MPGHEVEFVDTLDMSFECPVCWNALRSPAQATPGWSSGVSIMSGANHEVSFQGYTVYK